MIFGLAQIRRTLSLRQSQPSYREEIKHFGRKILMLVMRPSSSLPLFEKGGARGDFVLDNRAPQ